MARVDKIFQENLSLIMAQPWEDVKRPVYNDGTGVRVKRILQVMNQYDLRREFPISTIRPLNLKGCIKEILAIYQKNSTKIEDVGNIWLQWSDWKTSDQIVKVKTVRKEKPDHLNGLIEPLIEGNFEIGHSNNDGDFHIIKDDGRSNVLIQFVNTGYKTITTRELIKRGEIKDRYKRSVCGVGYLGNSYSQDIVDFFGEYHRRWISVWGSMMHRCYDIVDHDKTTKYYTDRDIFVDESFHSCENFLRWVMKNLRYDKSYLAILNIDKDYYNSNCYSADSCTLLTPSENKCLTGNVWYEYDDMLFISKTRLALYLKSKGYRGVTKFLLGKEYSDTPVFNTVVDELIKSGVVSTIDPHKETMDGYVYRFDLKPIRHIDGCYGSMVKRPVLLKERSPFYGSNYYDEGLGYYGFKTQVDFILWSLHNDKTSRRMLISMFDPLTNNVKPLQECAFQINFSVKNDELYMTLYQRSMDVITAMFWNTAQYAALMMMFAHDAGLKPAVFTHFVQDMHVYDRHEAVAYELLRRPNFGPIPQVTISSRMEDKGFYDFTPDDFEVWNYEPQPQVKFEVAK